MLMVKHQRPPTLHFCGLLCLHWLGHSRERQTIFHVDVDEDSYKQRKQLCYLLDLLSGEISLFSEEQIFGPPRILPARSVSYGPTGTEYFAQSCVVTRIERNFTIPSLKECISKNGWSLMSDLQNISLNQIKQIAAQGIYDASTTSFTYQQLQSFEESTLVALCPIPKLHGCRRDSWGNSVQNRCGRWK